MMAADRPVRVHPRQRNVRRVLLTLLTLAGTTVGLLPVATVADARPASVHRLDAFSNVKADYDLAIRESAPRADGLVHVNTPATIAKLQQLHVTTYAFLVSNNSTDWNDLRNEFLPAAQTAGIKVWAYLTPPSESASQPYGTDFVSWGNAIATLANQYSSLVAWVIDDFADNLSFFTTTYLQQIRSSYLGIDPAMKLFLVLYEQNYTQSFVNTYSSYLDGVIFPYLDGGWNDLFDTTLLGPELDSIVSLLGPLGKDIFLMPYASTHSEAPLPVESFYIRSVINTGLQYMQQGKIAGVITYATPLTPSVEQCPSVDVSTPVALRSQDYQPTSGGDYAEAKQTVSLTPGASSYALDFDESDSFPQIAGLTGYYQEQLLVNGQVAWQKDPTTDDARVWYPVHVDLTSQLHGLSSATVDFRLLNANGVSNFGLWWLVAPVVGTGFATTFGNWDYTATSSVFKASAISYTCDVNRQQDIQTEVQNAYQ